MPIFLPFTWSCRYLQISIAHGKLTLSNQVQVAVQEVRRLQKYGVTNGELERYKACLLRDSKHLAEQWQSVPSVDNLDYCMECLALDHTFMAQEEVSYLLLCSVCDAHVDFVL